MEPSRANQDEWFAPRTNRRLYTAQSSGEQRMDHTITQKWSPRGHDYNNATFVPDTPIKKQFDHSFREQGRTEDRGDHDAAGTVPERRDTYPQRTLSDPGGKSVHHQASVAYPTIQHTSASMNRSPSDSNYQQGYYAANNNPFLSLADNTSDVQLNISDLSNASSDFGNGLAYPNQKKHERSQSSASAKHTQKVKSHQGFNIPKKAMSQDEGGYLNRSNTSLNKSQSSLRSDEANISWNIPKSGPVARSESTSSYTAEGTKAPTSIKPTSPDCNLSFSVQDASPLFLVQRFQLLFENNKLEECVVLLQRISLAAVREIIRDLNTKDIINAIPHTLGILHVLYAKLYDPYHVEGFPADYLLPYHLVSRFVEWLSQSDEAMYNREHGPYAHNLPLIHDILQIIAHVQPQVFHSVSRRKRALDQCLRGLGGHGLVDTCTPDNTLMNLHDALKVKFQQMIFQLKAGIQRLDDTSLSHKNPVLRSLHRGKAPTSSSHQRMMQVTQSEVQHRLIKNKSLLNDVQPAITNTYLQCLMDILEVRIAADKQVLFLFTELNKDLPTNLQPNQMLAPAFQSLSHSYGKVLAILKRLPPCGNDCNFCDGRGLIHDWESDIEDTGSPVLGSTTSFAGGTGPGGTSQGQVPLDRDKPRVPGTARGHHHGNREHHSGPIGIPVASANGTAHSNLPCSLPTNTGSQYLEERIEADSLRGEVSALRKELSKCRDSLRKMQDRESVLKDRLSEQALKQIEKGSTKFEDLSLGDNRPTQLIRRYGNLYSETRLDAFDALEDLPEIAEFDDLKGKLLFSVVVLAFRAVQRSLSDTRSKVRHLLCMPSPDAKTTFAREPIVRELEDTISVYLRKFVDKYDSTKNVETPLHDLTEEVCTQVWSTLYDYPSLKECRGLRQYIEECVRLAWALSVQNPPLVVEYDSKIFSEDCHTRFHTSDPESDRIKSILWPSLREGDHGPCVFKGVVIT